MGGYERVNEPDVHTSKNLINMHRHLLPSFSKALDCGAGIGRVSKYVLKDYFSAIDLVEQSYVQLNKAKVEVPSARVFYLSRI